MPPLPYAGFGSPAIASISGVISCASAIGRAVGSVRGSAVYRPSMSDSMTSASALAICATCAARRSLSPKRISAVATVSFSLIIGTAPRRRIVFTVERALR